MGRKKSRINHHRTMLRQADLDNAKSAEVEASTSTRTLILRGTASRLAKGCPITCATKC
jgi:hypothetical protein